MSCKVYANMFTVSIAVVGAADLDDPCGLSLFPACRGVIELVRASVGV